MELPDGSLLAMGGKLFRSVDNGASWTNWTPEDNFGVPLAGLWREAYFTTANEGYMAGGAYILNNYGIGHTIDGGLTWTMAYLDNTGNLPRLFHDMHFATAAVAYAVGTNGRVVKTVNGGAAWSVVPFPTASTLVGVKFWDAATGLVASNSQVYRTVNGGTNWSATATPGTIGALEILPTGEAYMAGDGFFMVSTDQGQTWTTHIAPFASAHDVLARDVNTILVSAGANLYKSTDGGTYWYEYPAPANTEIDRVLFTDAVTGYAAGSDGKILKTTNGGGITVPIASFSHTITPGCGQSVLNMQATCDPALTITWKFNGLVVGTGMTASLPFTAPSTSGTVMLVASNGAATDSVQVGVTVTVDQPVTANAGPDLLLCANGSSVLAGTGGPSGSWLPTTGLATPNALTTAVQCTTNTVYTLTVVNGLCTGTDQVLVEVAAPIPALTHDTILDLNQHQPPFIGFSDPLHGAMMNQMNVYYTSDGGDNWTVHTGGQNQTGTLSTLHQLDPFWGIFSYGSLWRSDDSWNTKEDLLPSGFNAVAYAVRMVDRDTGYFATNAGFGGGYQIYRTYDGGASWELKDEGLGVRWYNRLTTYGRDTAVAVGGGSNVALLRRSTDGGNTWSGGIIPGLNQQAYDVTFTPNGQLFVVVGSMVGRSSDLGITWEWQTVSSSGGIGSHVAFADDMVGYATFNNEFYATVNGGDCWQLMYTIVGTFNGLEVPAPGIVYTTHYTAIPARTIVERSVDPSARYLGFGLSEESVCEGNTADAANGSIGYANYQWLVDGAPIGSAMNITLPTLAPGPHSIKLVGAIGLVSDTADQAFIVQQQQSAPVIEALTDYCWNQQTIDVSGTFAPGSAMHEFVGVNWPSISQTPGDTTNMILPMTPITSLGIIARSLDGHGCPSSWSDTLIVPYNAPPTVTSLLGPLVVCQDTLGNTVTQYELSRVTDAVHYTVYSLGVIDTVTYSDTTAFVHWIPGYQGAFYLAANATDACGTGSGPAIVVQLGSENGILLQPQDLSVNLTDAIHFEVSTWHPTAFPGEWYHNGLPTGDFGLSYDDPSADAADAGYYMYVLNDIGNCPDVVSDSALLTVNLNVGMNGAGGVNEALAAHILSDGELWIHIPNSGEHQVSIFDTDGRLRERRLIVGETPVRWPLGETATGILFVNVPGVGSMKIFMP